MSNYKAQDWREGVWQEEANSQGSKAEDLVVEVLNKYFEYKNLNFEASLHPSTLNDLFLDLELENSEEKLGYDPTQKNDEIGSHHIDESGNRHKLYENGWGKKGQLGLSIDCEIKNLNNGNTYLKEVKRQGDRGNAWERAGYEAANIPMILEKHEEVKGVGFVFSGGIVDGVNGSDYIYKVDATLNQSLQFMDIPDEVADHDAVLFWRNKSPELLVKHFENEIRPLIE